MDFASSASCAGIALALVILQLLFFVTALRGFVAEERKKQAETAAQLLCSLGISCKSSSMNRSAGTGGETSPSSTDEKNNHVYALRSRASSSASDISSHKKRAVASVKSSRARDIRSTKLPHGSPKRSSPLSSRAESATHRPRETVTETGRPKMTVSSGCRFYGNVVEKTVRAHRVQISPPTTLVGAVSRPQSGAMMRNSVSIKRIIPRVVA
jgi:hypothetical protein